MQNPNPLREHELMLTRRQLFGRTALGLGTAAMANLLGPELLADDSASPAGLHHPAKAKRVIYLFMSGGPSHHDLVGLQAQNAGDVWQAFARTTFETASGSRG